MGVIGWLMADRAISIFRDLSLFLSLFSMDVRVDFLCLGLYISKLFGFIYEEFIYLLYSVYCYN